MTESVRPPLWPQLQRPSAPAPKLAPAADPRAAFFRQALDRAGAAPAPAAAPEPARAAAPPLRPAADAHPADPSRPLRPGSLLNIRV